MGYGRYLRRRGYTYYFRCRWPKHFADFRLSGELQVGLRTRDYKLALHRARLLRTGMETLVTRFTPTISKADAEAIVRRWIDSALWRREAHLAETDGIAFFDPGEIETMGRENAAELDALLQFGDRRHAGDQKAAIARALSPIGPGLESYADIIDGAGRQMDLPVDRATPEGRLNIRLILRGMADAYSGRFVQYRKGIKLHDPNIDFRSFRGNVVTEIRNLSDVNAGWVDELIGHKSQTRRSEGSRYTKAIFLTHLRKSIDRIAIGVDPYNPKKNASAGFPASQIYRAVRRAGTRRREANRGIFPAGAARDAQGADPRGCQEVSEAGGKSGKHCERSSVYRDENPG